MQFSVKDLNVQHTKMLGMIVKNKIIMKIIWIILKFVLIVIVTGFVYVHFNFLTMLFYILFLLVLENKEINI
jgi:hypothetical protein